MCARWEDNTPHVHHRYRRSLIQPVAVSAPHNDLTIVGLTYSDRVALEMVHLLSIGKKDPRISSEYYILSKLADRLLCQLSLCARITLLLAMPSILQSSYRNMIFSQTQPPFDFINFILPKTLVHIDEPIDVEIY